MAWLERLDVAGATLLTDVDDPLEDCAALRLDVVLVALRLDVVLTALRLDVVFTALRLDVVFTALRLDAVLTALRLDAVVAVRLLLEDANAVRLVVDLLRFLSHPPPFILRSGT